MTENETTGSGGAHPRREGRPSRFTPEIGAALIDLTINEGLPIKHAARRLGFGVRTVYDWLERARNEGAAPELVEWAGTFAQSLEGYRRDKHGEKSVRDDKVAQVRWQRFKASREEWWRRRLGESAFWTRRLNWLAARRKWISYERTVARLRAGDYRVTRT
jgi:transposase